VGGATVGSDDGSVEGSDNGAVEESDGEAIEGLRFGVTEGAVPYD